MRRESFPLDEELAFLPGMFAPPQQSQLAQFRGWMIFRCANRVPEHLLGVQRQLVGCASKSADGPNSRSSLSLERIPQRSGEQPSPSDQRRSSDGPPDRWGMSRSTAAGCWGSSCLRGRARFSSTGPHPSTILLLASARCNNLYRPGTSRDALRHLV